MYSQYENLNTGEISFTRFIGLAVLMLASFVLLVLRNDKVSQIICQNVAAVQLTRNERLASGCRQNRLPSHLSLYHAFLIGELSATQHGLSESKAAHPLAVRTIGLALFEKGKTSKAIQVWKEAAYYSGLAEMALTKFGEGELQAAREIGQARLDLGNIRPDEWRLLWTMIQIELHTTRDIKNILSLTDSVTSINPNVWVVYAWAGRWLWEHEDYTRSQQVYTAGAQKFPTRTELWMGLARNAQSMNDTPSMCYFFEHILQLEFNPHACNGISTRCQELVSPEILVLCGDE